jgi:hypothetical protein
MLVYEELENCIKMSLAKTKELPPLDDFFNIGTKINMLGVRQVNESITDLF